MRSENVGMSNRNAAAYAAHRKSEVSLAMIIIQGLGDPNSTPKGLEDGQPVNIPAHSLDNLEMTQSKSLEGLLDFYLVNYESFQRQDCPEKFQVFYLESFVPQNRHRWTSAKRTQVNERNLVKELGKKSVVS